MSLSPVPRFVQYFAAVLQRRRLEHVAELLRQRAAVLARYVPLGSSHQ